jgi:hypothetical protein
VNGPPAGGAAALLRGRSSADAVVYGVVALLVVAALALPPLCLALDPRLRASLRYQADAPDDPWGRPWVVDVDGVRSAGPDGVDERGRGDDVALLPPGDPRLRLAAAGGEAAFGLAVVLAILWELGRAAAGWARAPRGGVALELGRAAVLALPLAAVLGAVALGLRALLPSVREALVEAVAGRMLIDPELALGLTLYAAAFALVAGLRLRAPGSGAKTEDPPGR